MKFKKIINWFSISLIVIFFTALVYFEYLISRSSFNLIYSRHLFYLPIILSGIFYGILGGTFVGFVSIFSFAPIFLFQVEKNGFDFKSIEYFLTMVIFILLGLTSGLISQKINHIKNIYKSLYNIEKTINNSGGIEGILKEINNIFNSDFSFFISKQKKDSKYLVISKNKFDEIEETKNILFDKDSLIYKLLIENKKFISKNLSRDQRVSLDLKNHTFSDYYFCATSINYLKKSFGVLGFFKEEKISKDDFKLFISIANNIGINFQNKKLYNFAVTDNLTGAFNRRYFDISLNYFINQIPQKIITLVMLDIDHFKKINDGYGHQKGDDVLKKVVEIFKKFSTKNPVCRFGGEEFSIIFSNMKKEEVYPIIENIRKDCEKNLLHLLPDKKITTVSAGIASFPKDANNLEDLIKKSDEALYEAKNSGRNKVVLK